MSRTLALKSKISVTNAAEVMSLQGVSITPETSVAITPVSCVAITPITRKKLCGNDCYKTIHLKIFHLEFCDFLRIQVENLRFFTN